MNGFNGWIYTFMIKKENKRERMKGAKNGRNTH